MVYESDWEVEMLITLAVIGALALLAWFLKSIGLKEVSVKFESKPTTFRMNRSLTDEKPPKELQ